MCIYFYFLKVLLTYIQYFANGTDKQAQTWAQRLFPSFVKPGNHGKLTVKCASNEWKALEPNHLGKIQVESTRKVGVTSTGCIRVINGVPVNMDKLKRMLNQKQEGKERQNKLWLISEESLTLMVFQSFLNHPERLHSQSHWDVAPVRDLDTLSGPTSSRADVPAVEEIERVESVEQEQSLNFVTVEELVVQQAVAAWL